MDADLQMKIDEACRTAQKFTKVYYKYVDKRRHLISKFYLDTGLLTWNGNGIFGKQAIQKFYLELPPSEHTIASFDGQPISNAATHGQLACLIQVSGNVKYKDKAPNSFQQNFVLTVQGDKWRIVTDCFRTQEV